MRSVTQFPKHRRRVRPRWYRTTIAALALPCAVTSAALIGYFGFEPTSAAGNSSQSIVGRPTVVDGDTIELRGERVRLNGVDAPEAKQLCQDKAGHPYRCGAVSAKELADLLAVSSPTRCQFVTRDRYGRFVGDCFRADGKSVSQMMVRLGMAMDYTHYSKGVYLSEQAEAKAAHVGIWQGAFQAPWEWRAEQGSEPQGSAASVSPASEDSISGCRIKGNINTNGEHIYHLPGQEHYGETQISAAKGERWFCSEDEARTAGWRKARK